MSFLDKNGLSYFWKKLKSKHIDLKTNPHEVTAEQVNTYIKSDIDTKISDNLTSSKSYTDSEINKLQIFPKHTFWNVKNNSVYADLEYIYGNYACGGSKAVYSDDGITWKEIASGGVSNDLKFIIKTCSSSDPRIYIDASGNYYKVSSSAFSKLTGNFGTVTCVCYCGNTTYIANSSGTISACNTTGFSWFTVASLGVSIAEMVVDEENKKIYVFTNSSSKEVSVIDYNSNAVTSYNVPIFDNITIKDVTIGNGYILVAGSSSIYRYKIDDDISNWIEITGYGASTSKCIFNRGVFYLLKGTRIYVSADCITWYLATSGVDIMSNLGCIDNVVFGFHQYDKSETYHYV